MLRPLTDPNAKYSRDVSSISTCCTVSTCRAVLNLLSLLEWYKHLYQQHVVITFINIWYFSYQIFITAQDHAQEIILVLSRVCVCENLSQVWWLQERQGAEGSSLLSSADSRGGSDSMADTPHTSLTDRHTENNPGLGWLTQINLVQFRSIPLSAIPESGWCVKNLPKASTSRQTAGM